MNKEEQKKLLTEVMDADTKDGLYEPTVSKMETPEKTNHIGDTNKMVTAVEWFSNELHKFINGNSELNGTQILEQAKAMEKEHIINAYIDGEHQQGFEGEAEQYYNETYK